MENKTTSIQKNQDNALLLKIFAAILPAFIFMQDLAWLTANATGWAWFWIFLLVIILAVARTGKYEGLSRIFRFAEVATFFAPIAVFILALVANQGQFAGAVVGVMVMVVGAVVALFFGIIFHLIANSFKKKAVAIIATADMKKCPECAEMIKADAKKCRYCGKVLD